VTEPRVVTSRESVPLRRSGVTSGTALSAWWLGQAGFLVEAAGVRLVIDAYLSDTLAVKYRGTLFPHVRMMPPPVAPGALRDVDVVLATHGHTDHLDPGTLSPLAAANPACRFVVPAAHADLAVSRGVPPERLVRASAFAALEVAGVRLHPLPSAHEELSMDAAGEHLFLGYVMEFPSAVIYHPGDCVPYPDLPFQLHQHELDLALLPVNGRDARRAQGGVPGNFTLEEALSLAGVCGVDNVIGHHFGMFDFNTIDVAAARARLVQEKSVPTFLLAESGVRYDLRRSTRRETHPPGTVP
jgi:L-ascorbate metabolism protein UlaG (beta-lactamase superfamily)